MYLYAYICKFIYIYRNKGLHTVLGESNNSCGHTVKLVSTAVTLKSYIFILQFNGANTINNFKITLDSKLKGNVIPLR